MKHLAFLLSLIAAPCFAAGPFPVVERKVYAANGDILAVNRSVGVSYLKSGLYYIEPSANTGVNTGTNYLDYEQGTLKGAKIEASWMTAEEQWYLHAEWAGAEGQIPYTGFTQPPALMPVNATSRATTQDYLIKFGRGINVRERWMLTPYVSLGGRHWTRVLALGSAQPFNETYKHYYFTFGGRLQYNPWDRLVATVDAAFGGTFRPEINDPPDGLNHTALGTSAIFKGGLELDGRVSERIHLFSSFDYMAFSYGRSDNISIGGGNAVFEPDSNTQVFNFNFGARYSFGGKS